MALSLAAVLAGEGGGVGTLAWLLWSSDAVRFDLAVQRPPDLGGEGGVVPPPPSTPLLFACYSSLVSTPTSAL